MDKRNDDCLVVVIVAVVLVVVVVVVNLIVLLERPLLQVLRQEEVSGNQARKLFVLNVDCSQGSIGIFLLSLEGELNELLLHLLH